MPGTTKNSYSHGHGAIIQNTSNNNRNMLESMIKKNNINSGRVRNQINSTTIRQENPNSGGRIFIKKALSPGIDASQGPNYNTI